MYVDSSVVFTANGGCCFWFAGPLVAVINAQAQAAMSTINFVNSVGFNANKEAIMVAFKYNVTNATTGLTQTNQLTVPILTIMPIPFLRVRGAC